MRTDTGEIAGLVLAAGSSTRFGRNKLLLDFGGEPLVRRAATTALAAGLDPVVVVLGHEAGPVRDALAGLSLRTLVNGDHARGLNTSLAAGLAALPPDSAAAVIQLADMPLVTAEMVKRLVDAFRDTGAPIVASDYGGIQAPPTLYARALFLGLAGSEGGGAGKRLVRGRSSDVVRIAFPADALADVDREDDWDRIRLAAL